MKEQKMVFPIFEKLVKKGSTTNSKHCVKDYKILLNSTQWVYTGPLKDGKPHGKGKLVSYEEYIGAKRVKETYTGNFEEGKRHGKGRYEWKDGASYEGQWYDGEIHGYGSFIHANGDTFTGQFLAGKRHGSGKYRYQNGDVYEGTWSSDLKHGNGTMSWAAAVSLHTEPKVNKLALQRSSFQGEWKFGKPNGIGIKISPSIIIEGYFEDGKMHGYCKETHLDEHVFRGNQVNGVYAGYGLISLKIKDVEIIYTEGIFKNGILNGHGIKTLPNGLKYDGEWKDDLPNGNGILFCQDGNAIVVEHERGKLVKTRHQYTKHSKLASDVLQRKPVFHFICPCVRRAIKFRMGMSKTMFTDESYPYVYEKKINLQSSAIFVGTENLKSLRGFSKIGF
eukprot:snap_masked-scaffold_54-processed-gene-1.32-mRNA-1 protein AED:0.55 eAED:0.56 QI:0/0/0/1/1/1/2/0/391